MKIKESGEMYLETIYILSKKMPSVRSVDIAEELNFSRPSVSRAIRVLEKNGLLYFDNKTKIILTPEGVRKAQSVMERHKILTAFLVSIGIEANIAEEDACRIEHVISDHSFTVIKDIISKK